MILGLVKDTTGNDDASVGLEVKKKLYVLVLVLINAIIPESVNHPPLPFSGEAQEGNLKNMFPGRASKKFTLIMNKTQQAVGTVVMMIMKKHLPKEKE